MNLIPIFNQALEELESLKTQSRLLPLIIVGHMNPDADSIGSQSALCRYFLSRAWKSFVYLHENFPENLRSYVQDLPLVSELPQKAIYCAVDCANHERTKVPFPFFLNIDHHPGNPHFAKYNIVNEQSTSTTEILSNLFQALSVAIDQEIAQALFLGMAVDSGRFLYPSVSQETFMTAAWLVSKKALPHLIDKGFYKQDRPQRLQLLILFLSSLQYWYDEKVVVGILTEENFLQAQAQLWESDGFVDYTTALKKTVIGIYIQVLKHKIKVSLRAKDPKIEVNRLAQTFGGFGHDCAAGFQVSQEPLALFLEKLQKAIEQHLDSVCI